jgi:hypothetical protein
MLKTTVAALVLAAFCTTLTAQNTETEAQANARKFIASLDAIRPEVVGKHKLFFTVAGIPMGDVTIDIEATTFDGTPCYRVAGGISTIVDGVEMVTSGASHADVKGSLLFGVAVTRMAGVVMKEETAFATGDGFEKLSSEAGEAAKRQKHGRHDRLADASTDLLVLLLSSAAAGEYEFVSWSEDGEEFLPVTISVNRNAELNGRKTTCLTVSEQKAELKDGKLKRSTDVDVYWVRESRFVAIENARHGMDATPERANQPEGQISKEMFSKLDSPEAAALAFLHVMYSRDKELADRCVNWSTIARALLDEMVKEGDLDPSMLEMVLPTVIENLKENFLKEDTPNVPLGMIGKFLAQKGMMQVVKTEAGDTIVGPSDRVPEGFREEGLWLKVTQGADGKWQVVSLPAEREALEGKKEPEKPKKDPKEEEEEEF